MKQNLKSMFYRIFNKYCKYRMHCIGQETSFYWCTAIADKGPIMKGLELVSWPEDRCKIKNCPLRERLKLK